MKNILIIGIYPNENNIKDGMVRRIKEIDMKLEKTYKRIYLNISFRKNLKKSFVKNDNLEIYNLNFFKDYFFIRKNLRMYKKIYIHSLYNYLKIYFFKNINEKDIILDIHGVVPEEKKYEGKKYTSVFFNYLEKKLFKKLSKIIFVTNQMKEYYLEKYPSIVAKKANIILPILDSKKENIEHDNITEDRVVIIYSGNLQKWQNIDLMLEVMKKNLSERLLYIFLTGEKEQLKKQISKVNIDERYYLIDSVQPNELSKYYNIANYGLILRDDDIVNRVANPTKLGEYLDYGIIPIVKLEEIGDYNKMGYEHIKMSDNLNILPKLKSKKNINIMKNYRKEISRIDFIKFIENGDNI